MAVLLDFGETLVERVVDDIRPLSEHTIRPFPETVATIEDLARAGFDLAIVSNTFLSTESDLRTALRSMGIEDHFGAVVTSHDVGHRKPRPEIFRRALQLLDCPTGRALMVGDDLDADIRGATALGISAVFVDRRPDEVIPPGIAPDHRITSLAELPAIVSDGRYLP